MISKDRYSKTYSTAGDMAPSPLRSLHIIQTPVTTVIWRSNDIRSMALKSFYKMPEYTIKR